MSILSSGRNCSFTEKKDRDNARSRMERLNATDHYNLEIRYNNESDRIRGDLRERENNCWQNLYYRFPLS